MIREHISPSMRFELREAIAWLREQLGRACLWRWEITRLAQHGDSPYNILYAGRKTQRELAKALLGADSDLCTHQVDLDFSSRTAFVSEMPFPGALRVPQTLSSVVPLGRPIEEITASFESELRRRIRKHRARYRMQLVLDDTGIDRADREMLQPYARARHGISASQIRPDEIRRMALKFGRLENVILSDEVTACQLACAVTRAGERYWSSIRVGYPEAVFSDRTRLSETNSINFYLALEWALENNFDYFDMGSSLGRPEDALLQWKKRWGGKLVKMSNHGYFYIRPPKAGTAQFFWDAPLFAVERHNMTLHLGLPNGPNDDVISIRYRKMNFGGLFKVYLHCARPPGDQLLEKLRGLYTHQKLPPIMEIIPST